MSDETERVLYRSLKEDQSKYAYFLLAGAATALGFALTQTSELTLSWNQTPLGIATAFWAASFYCGCKHLQYSNSVTYNNVELLRIETGRHPISGNNRQAMEIGSVELREILV